MLPYSLCPLSLGPLATSYVDVFEQFKEEVFSGNLMVSGQKPDDFASSRHNLSPGKERGSLFL
jgi:hypothetical protein